MSLRVRYSLIFFSLLVFVCHANAQADQFCGEVGLNPTLDSPFARLPYVYGHISLKGFQSGAKLPKITILLIDTQNSPSRWTRSPPQGSPSA